MKIRCEICQSILGERTPTGIVIRKENHKDLLVEGVVQIWCENKHLNLVTTTGESTRQEAE